MDSIVQQLGNMGNGTDAGNATNLPEILMSEEGRAASLLIAPITLLFGAPFIVHTIHSTPTGRWPHSWKSAIGMRCVLGAVLIMIQLVPLIATGLASEHTLNLPFISQMAQHIGVLFGTIASLLLKSRGSAASGALFLYWFFSVLCYVTTAIHASLKIFRGEFEPIYGAEVAVFLLFASQLILTFFADQKDPNSKVFPESSASFPSQSLFHWFTPLAIIGHRQPIGPNDIYKIRDSDKSPPLYDRLTEQYWDRVKEHMAKSNDNGEKTTAPPSLLWAIFRTFKAPILATMIYELFYQDVQFLSPILMHYLLTFLKDESQPSSTGYLLSVAMLSIYLSTALVSQRNLWTMQRLGLNVRSAVIQSVYRKALRLSSSARRSRTIGEIINLMAVDSNKVQQTAPWIGPLWVCPVTLVVAFAYLYTLVGPAALAGIVAICVMVPLHIFLTTKMRVITKEQMRVKDERVKMMSEILNGIKVLKLYAWERGLMNQVRKVRDREIDLFRRFSHYRAFSALLWRCAPFMITVLTFAVFVSLDHENNILTPEKTFVCFVVFNIITYPILQISTMYSEIIDMLVSIRRLEEFFVAEELDERCIGESPSRGNVLEMNSASFTWNGDAEGHGVLKDITFNVKDKQLVAVVGKVGCGKSSLISAIIGDLRKLTGSVEVSGRIALVPQQAWILNMTLKDNILFGRPLDVALYESTLEACALLPDLAMLPAGDATEIGEKGINLSGGQKARVSLARAVYTCLSSPEEDYLVLLDDPLAAVDAHVARHIYERVISSQTGVLKGTARLLATHNLHYLKHCDDVAVLQDGVLSERGTYSELLAHQGPFAAVVKEFLIEEVTHKKTRNRQSTDRSIEEVLQDLESPQAIEKRLSEVLDELVEEDEDEDVPAEDTAPLIEPSTARIVVKEELRTDRVRTTVYLTYLRAVKYSILALTALLYVGTMVFEILAGLWLTSWTDHAAEIQKGPHGAIETDKRLAGYAAMVFAQSAAVCAAMIIMAYGARNASRKMHDRLLLNVVHSPMSFFDTTPIGRVLNRFSTDMDMVDFPLPRDMGNLAMQFMKLATTLFLSFYAIPLMIGPFVPIVIFYYFVIKVYISTSRQLKRMESASRSPMYSHFQESLQGASSIRAYRAQDRFAASSAERVDANSNYNLHRCVANRWLAVLLELSGNLIVLAAAVFAVYMRDSPALTAGLVGLTISYALNVTSYLGSALRMTTEMENKIVSVERIIEYSEHNTEGLPVEGDPRDSKWPARGEIVFSDFQLRYRPGLDLVLRGIDLRIKPGEKVGIVGRTGAGKSSLTLAIFRIVEAAGGYIEIDGERIDRLRLETLRSRITIVPQDPVLFSGSLRLNLDPMEAHSDDEVRQAIRRAHLDDFVASLPDGLNHEVAESGENFSVGQRQLLCLARALLRKTKILVLDEAAAAVDIESDALIQQAVRDHFSDCTVLTIAHRLNTVLDYDRVIVMADGLIVENGSPRELMASEGTAFRDMARHAGLV